MGQAVFICHYDYETDSNGNKKCKWLLTTDELDARATDQSYNLASIHDLNEWVAATSEVFTGIILSKDGQCKWEEFTFPDKYGIENYSCGYELI